MSVKKKPKKIISKKIEKHNYFKIMCILISILIIVCVGVFGVYRICFDKKAKSKDISLDKMRQGGAVIYSADKQEYTTLDIGKCGRWISNKELYTEIKDIDKEVDIDYARLIIEQFYRYAEDKKMLARALELKYSTKELEEFFVNTVYLGDGVFGIASASKRFCGCEYDLLMDEDKQLLKEVICTYVLEGEYPIAHKAIYNQSVIYEENSYIDGVAKEVANKLIENGMAEYDAYDMIFRQNIHIYTHMDVEVMKQVNKAYDEKTTFVDDSWKNSYIQSAMVVMDHKGNVKAVAGGNNQDKVFNRAMSSNYQVGSTIKPISTYSLAIENKLINFSTMIVDEQMYITSSDGTEKIWPTNHDGRYEGLVSVTRALQRSKNTVAVKIGTMVGEDNMYSFLEEKLGYDLAMYENNNTDKQLAALSLGYLCKGVSLAKLTASYEMFGNGGKFYDFTMIREVVDEEGNMLFDDIREGKQVLLPQSAYIMNRLLYNNVNGEYGIADGAKINDVEVLGKTGTTVDDSGKSISNLFVGVTSDYIVGVWLGYDNKMPLASCKYKEADEIFSTVVSQFKNSNMNFEVAEGVIECEFCECTGEIATEYCKNTSKGYYTDDNMPTNC